MVLAASVMRVPTLVLEQNVIPGATNRLLGRLARRVCVSFPETATSFPGAKVVCTGNPVRREIALAARRRSARAGEGTGKGQVTLLVVGGSAGAHHLNVEVVEAIGRLGSWVSRLRVLHQTGAADAETARARYDDLGVEADVQPFFAEMADVYETADLVVCRAGATTIAELLTVGLPAILVPYPYAADDHQRRNAEAVAAVGAGVLILDRELTAERLAAALLGLIDDPTKRQQMAHAARTLARPDAGRMVAEQCAAVVAGNTR
jgi:UDP-N-acetylglucosamine--N-acetylmuramyl-(pentapeptide) pyrophosphoryl-undecaprenol N-acetylglucosamine transferase